MDVDSRLRLCHFGTRAKLGWQGLTKLCSSSKVAELEQSLVDRAQLLLTCAHACVDSKWGYLQTQFQHLAIQASLRGMCPFWHVFFTLNWLTLTPKTHSVQFYLKVAYYLLSWGKNKVTLGMRLLWKYIRKSKLVYQKRYTFCYNFLSIVNLKLKFWD